MASLTALVRIGRDAELRTIPNGNNTQVCNFAACYKYGRKLDDGYPVQWIDLAMFGVQAEKLTPYLLKGQLIMAVISDVHIESFNRHDGTQGHKLVGTVQSVEFAGSVAKTEGAQQPRKQAQQRPAQQPADNFDDYNDVPF